MSRALIRTITMTYLTFEQHDASFTSEQLGPSKQHFRNASTSGLLPVHVMLFQHRTQSLAISAALIESRWIPSHPRESPSEEPNSVNGPVEAFHTDAFSIRRSLRNPSQAGYYKMSNRNRPLSRVKAISCHILPRGTDDFHRIDEWKDGEWYETNKKEMCSPCVGQTGHALKPPTLILTRTSTRGVQDLKCPIIGHIIYLRCCKSSRCIEIKPSTALCHLPPDGIET